MRILGIETSCDETAIAVLDIAGSTVKPRVRVLSNIVASQVKLHAKFGGVVPNLGKREHQKNLVPVLFRALHESGIMNHESRGRTVAPRDSRLQILNSILERESDLFARMVPKVTALSAPKVDAIAVTVGPGLAPALWVGVNFARALAYLWGKPLIAVNHLEGHIYTNLLQKVREDKSPASATATAGRRRSNVKGSRYPITYPLAPFIFPALCLIVSGGHTELVLMSGYGKYGVLGETRDDAAGEAFDKVARMMALGFPGGPVIQHLAETGDSKAFNFPRPMISSANFDFSFSGLKTAVLYALRDIQKLTTETKRNIAASFEQAVVDVLVAKTIRAAREHRVKTVIIGGGVAANKKLRHQLGAALRRSYPSASYLVPDLSLTGDNALMIALAAYFNRRRKVSWRSVSADANLRLDTPH